MAKAHRLVASAFIANPAGKPEVNHKDCDTRNNWDWNLEWATHHENMRHAADNNLIAFNPAKGSKSNLSKLTEPQVIEIKERLKFGEAASSISNDYPVGAKCIKEIKAGRSWAHMP